MKTIAISDLTERTQKRAYWLGEDRPVYARPTLRGYRLMVISFIPVNSDQYEAEEQKLADNGWGKVDFTA